MLKKEQIEKIEELTKFIKTLQLCDFNYGLANIEINPDSEDYKYRVRLNSFYTGVIKENSGSDLNKCIQELINDCSTEIIQTHNRLQDQLTMLKKAIDFIK